MQQVLEDVDHATYQAMDQGVAFRNDADVSDARCHYPVQSYAEVGRRYSLDRRVLAARVQHLGPTGRAHYSFFIGVCHRQPLSTVEQSALLLLFPFALDGTYRDRLEPTPIRLNGYEYAWYWCAHIVAAGTNDKLLSSMSASAFLTRIDAFDRYLATGTTQHILALIAQEMAYKGYFYA